MDMVTILRALSNEHRLRILEWLKDPAIHFSSKDHDVLKEGVTIGMIEKKCKLAQSTVSEYLSVLKNAELVTIERRAQSSFCKYNEQLVESFLDELYQRI